MDAATRSIKHIFGQDRRLIVPLFQRPYVWTREEQWSLLWDDIRGVAERILADQHVRAHFLGAIVLEQQRQSTGTLESRLVIDGQQRLTTVQLLLEAFADICEVSGADRHHKGLRKLTRNDDPMSEDPDDAFKIWPTNLDQPRFRQVMAAPSAIALRVSYGIGPQGWTGHPIADGYLFFYEVIAEWLDDPTSPRDEKLDALYRTLHDYVGMVVIDLSPEDDSMLIFETLNARGTPLLPSDLVKNFLFHRAQRSKLSLNRLYKDYWEPFDAHAKYWREPVGRGHARRARIDLFLQHFLTNQSGDEVPVAHLYAAYRDHLIARGGLDVTKELSAIKSYADLYRCFDTFEAASQEGRFFARLGELDVTTAYPFLLELYAVPMERADRLQVLSDLESFLVRRMICQLNTRGYNQFFLGLLNAIRAAEGTAVSRVRGFLTASDSESARWPADTEFERCWTSLTAYQTLVRGRVRMVLEAVEGALRSAKSEDVSIRERLTIEHLMPQGWREHWPLSDSAPAEEASIRDQLVQTFGNLTLVTKKLNPSLSNSAWTKKRPAILQHSALALTRELHPATKWDDSSIRERTQDMLTLAKKIWPAPPVSA